MLILMFIAPFAQPSTLITPLATLGVSTYRTTVVASELQHPHTKTAPIRFAGMDNSSTRQSPLLESVGKGSATAAEMYDDPPRRLDSRELEASHRHKAHRVNKKRGADYRSKGNRKGDAKRARKERALAQAERCQYYHDDQGLGLGLRRVRPYIYDFLTHAKARWLGRKVIDVFSAEFGGNPRSYYERAIRCGLLKVNGKTVDLDYEFKNNDVVCNRTHRHEPPVAGGEITIVSESEDEIVVDKPCTVPIHPCGSYRFNTLFYILQRQRPDLSLRVCHRLDRLTSGLTIFAKTAERAGVIQTQIGAGGTRKTYLARVSGDFGQRFQTYRRQVGSPSTFADACSSIRASDSEAVGSTYASGGTSLASKAANDDKRSETLTEGVKDVGELCTSPPSDTERTGIPETVDSPGELWWRYETPGKNVVRSDQTKDGGGARPNETTLNGAVAETKTKDGSGREGGVVIRVNCPIRVLDAKDGVYECHAKGKEAQTVIRKVSYDASSDTSLLECTPVHGRTHQIRLHLQWVGHPIANDPCYGGELHFGDPDARYRMEKDPSFHGWKGTSRARAATAVGAAIATARKEKDHPSEDYFATVAKLCDAHGSDAKIKPSAGSGSSSSSSGQSSENVQVGNLGSNNISAGDVEEKRDDEDDEAFVIRTCSMCQGGERFTKNQLHCVGIWLHALRYEGPDWAFETQMPSWATF